MKLRLKHKIMGLTLFSALLPVVAVLILATVQERRSNRVVAEEIDDIIALNLTQIVKDNLRLLENTDRMVQEQVDRNLSFAEYLMEEAGGVTIEPAQTQWRAVNQFTGRESVFDLNRMVVDGVALVQDRNPNAQPLVEQVSNLLGGTATIFQRDPATDALIRVATTVRRPDGRAATGTYTPATRPDGSTNEVVATILAGQTYRGRAYVVNDWYLTAYQPILTQGRIVGALYAGVRRDTASGIVDSLAQIDIGRNGFVWVMRASPEPNQTDFLLVGEPFSAQQRLEDIVDANGQPFFQAIKQDARSLEEGEVTSRKIEWIDPRNSEPRPLRVFYAYFAEWDWIVGITAFEEDFAGPRERIEHVFADFNLIILLGGLVMLIFIGVLSGFLSSLIARPITFVTQIARSVAEGDLAAANEAAQSECKLGRLRLNLQNANDETGELYRAMEEMIRQLHRLIGQVRTAGQRLLDASNEIHGSAKVQEGAVQDFGSSSAQIAAAVREISTTARELSQTMSNVSEGARDAAETAGTGYSKIDQMRQGTQKLSQATSSISDKLSVINDKANNIGDVITTIARVGDQTNLLSLNAAIEAEKAGEAGLGFAVVAREIRRLADQTAVATLDIEQMIQDMQSSVRAGVMENDRFNETVSGGIQDIATLSKQMENIIEKVQSLTPRFESVQEGMEAQASGATQISEAVGQLNSVAQQTQNSLDSFRGATNKLDEAVQKMDEGIQRFKVDEANTSARPEASA